MPEQGPALAAHSTAPAAAATVTATPAAASNDPCVFVPATAAIAPSCLVGIAASPIDQAVGVPRSFTLLCGFPVGHLSTFPGPGCYDVQATLMDLTTGSGAPFDSGICANVVARTGTTIDCSSVANPICPPGYVAPPTGGCSPCPAGSHLASGQCIFAPIGGTCPPGTTPFIQHGMVVYCYTGVLPTTVGPTNEMTATFTPTSPHIYGVTITGYIPTQTNGTCPRGTTLTANVPVATHVTATACQFTFRLTQRAEEINALVAAATGDCSAPIGSSLYYLVVGQGCLANIQAFGMVVVKVGVNCSNASEPATGSSAVQDGFPPGSVYQCIGDALSVTNIPVPDVPLSLTVTNGIFNPTCFPIYAAPSQPTTPTPIPSVTPLATPRPSPTPTPTATSVSALTPSPTAVPGASSASAFCSPPGQSTVTIVTGPNGVVNFFGNQVEYSAYANPSNPPPRSLVDIVGHFAVDNVPRPEVSMFAHFDAGNAETGSCGPSYTDGTGTAHCSLSTDSVPAGTTVNAMVDFILNCTDYSTTATFTVGGTAPSSMPPPVATAPAPNGLCVLRTGPGQVTVSVTYTSPLDTQPPVTVSNVPLGTFGFPTPTPAETPLPIPNATATPSNTAIPTATPRPTSTPLPTSTPTPTPTPTPTATPTARPSPTSSPTSTPTATIPPPPVPVSFTLDEARVSKLTDRGNHRGLNLAQQGQKVNLSIYYTVKSLPRAVARLTTYEIDHGSSVGFKAVYRGTQGATQLGPQVRFIQYTIPRRSVPDVYTFRATVQLGNVRKTAFWRFAVVRPALLSPH